MSAHRPAPPAAPRTVGLVAMPWCSVFNPSIQIATLAQVVAQAGYQAEQRSYSLAFVDFAQERAALAGREFSLLHYMEVGIDHAMRGLGDWVFAIPPFRPDRPDLDECFFGALRREGTTDETLERASWLRTVVPAFVESCVADLLSTRPMAVGFTTGFSQTIASLVVAQRLKALAPDVRILFGGADCDGPMGEGLIRAFPWIDAIVRGEGELVLPGLLDDIFESAAPRSQPGLCVRAGDDITIVPRDPTQRLKMDDIPTPDYSEFFERLARSPFRSDISRALELPVESSRGCWWGQKHHCTFCGFNGDDMHFRRKSAERFLGELIGQSARFHTLGFQMTDAILDPSYFHTVLPALAESGFDFRIFWETKVNLTRQQVELLREAGVVHVQPGVESLSTPILRAMRKGATALQNIRFLKWCRELGINALWNIIYGFPGEEASAYAEMANLTRSLGHLQPPSLVPLVIDRFSPYQMDPQAFGLRLVGPPSYYATVLPDTPQVRAELMNMAYRFEYEHIDGRDPETYVGPLRAAIDDWRVHYRGEHVSLRMSRGPDFLTVVDTRPNLPHGRYQLAGLSADVYLACDSGATVPAIAAAIETKCGTRPDDERVADILEELHQLRLLYREDQRYLSLAIPSRHNGAAAGLAL